MGLVADLGPAVFRSALRRPLFLALVLIAGIALFPCVPETASKRLTGVRTLTSRSTVSEVKPEGSAVQRVQIQNLEWWSLLDHLVFGAGLGAYPQANAMYAPDLGKRDTRNSRLNLAAEVGLPGLLLCVRCVGSVLRQAYKVRRVAASAWQRSKRRSNGRSMHVCSQAVSVLMRDLLFLSSSLPCSGVRPVRWLPHRARHRFLIECRGPRRCVG